MPFEVGDQVRIYNLDTVEEYNEEYDEYEEVDQPYIEDEMYEMCENDEVLTITNVSRWSGFITAGGYEWHPDWLIIHKKKPKIELTGANAISKYKVVITKVLEMEMKRKEKGHAY